MPTIINIGTLVSYHPELRDSRPMIAGTKTSVRRIVTLHNLNVSAEEIARRMSHLSLAQVYAALATKWSCRIIYIDRSG